MVLPLRDFLTTRRRELMAEIARLKRELGEVRVAEAALNGAAHGRGEGVPASGRPTLKEAALEVLREREFGAKASEIIAAINERYGTSFDRSSLSPQLSRLASDELVELIGRTWLLKQPPLAMIGAHEAERQEPQEAPEPLPSLAAPVFM